MDFTRNGSSPTGLDEVTAALDTLTVALSTEEDFAALLRRVCELVTKAVPGVDEATITLTSEGDARTVAATSDIVAGLDRDQYAIGDGPCIRAAEQGALVRVTVADVHHLWPSFARDSAAAGFGSFLCAPLGVDSEYSGAINCYGGSGAGFAELDEKLLDLYTSAATAALRVHTRYTRARDTADQLRTALTSRAVIDQAKGILMAIRRIDADQAFALLVEQSQRENVKLRELATRFVAQATAAQP